MSGPNLSPQSKGQQPKPKHADETDYQHRNFINLVAVVALLVIAIGVVWVVKAMEADEALNRCLSTGRRDCVRIDVPPRATVHLPDN